MPTIRELADELGVSKTAISNWLAELDPARAHLDTTKKPFVIDETMTSMIAHYVQRRDVRPDDPEEEAARGRMEALSAVVSVSDSELKRQREHYEALAAAREEAHAALIAEKDRRIADLKEQVGGLRRQLDAERAAHEATRRSLELSRELEGFKWPWQRREIRERYALPAPQGGDA